MLWCATQLVDIMPKDYEDLHIAVVQRASEVLSCERLISLKLVATRTLVKFARKVKPEQLQMLVQDNLEVLIGKLASLLDTASLDTLHLPIEAFTQFSKMNETLVAAMAPMITPKLLSFFKAFHHEAGITQELLNLFKIWCNYDACRDIFVNTFIPFIMDIIDMYYRGTPNADNRDSVLLPQAKSDEVEAVPV